MLSIRLQRTGKRNQPQFRIVLAEKQKHPTKKFIEVLGSYNPRTKEFQLRNPERAKYWLDQNVEVSPTVHNLLVSKEILKGQTKVQAWRPKKKSAEDDKGTASEQAQSESKAEQQSEEPAESTATPSTEESSTPAEDSGADKQAA